jgi:hypothetical protein
VLAEGDPIATQLLARFHDVRMPNLGLASGEVALLLDYLAEQDRGAAVKNGAMP